MFIFFSTNKLIAKNQYCSNPSEYCISQVLSINHEVLTSFDNGLEVKRVFLALYGHVFKLFHSYERAEKILKKSSSSCPDSPMPCALMLFTSEINSNEGFNLAYELNSKTKTKFIISLRYVYSHQTRQGSHLPWRPHRHRLAWFSDYAVVFRGRLTSWNH